MKLYYCKKNYIRTGFYSEIPLINCPQNQIQNKIMTIL